tara:strand:- start:49 stop:258 length:210 start_codon:yes stop_codon:yes gene_type:complete
MKLFINSFLFFLALIIFENKVLSLNDYQIKEFCQKKKLRSSCIKKLREKKYNLLNGERIEIEVIPFKKY